MSSDYYSQVIDKIGNLKDEAGSNGIVGDDAHLDLLILGLVTAYFSDDYAEQRGFVERIYERMKSPDCSLSGVEALVFLLQSVLDHSQDETINGVLLAPRRRRKKAQESGAKGGKKAAKVNNKVKAIKEVREMWLDYQSGNKEGYKHQGKTGKTAFVRYVLNKSHYGVLESEQWLLRKIRQWEKGENIPTDQCK